MWSKDFVSFSLLGQYFAHFGFFRSGSVLNKKTLYQQYKQIVRFKPEMSIQMINFAAHHWQYILQAWLPSLQHMAFVLRSFVDDGIRCEVMVPATQKRKFLTWNVSGDPQSALVARLL